MRTTLTIDDGLLREAKARAARTGVTVSQFVEDAIRAAFARRVSQSAHRTTLPTSPGAPRPGIELDNGASLLEIMEREA